METASYQQFQQEVGRIIILWSRVEERFRALLSQVAGLEQDAGEIIFNRVSAHKQRNMLTALALLRHSDAAISDLEYLNKLHVVNSENRNLFAHGHVGFMTFAGERSFAFMTKPHVGRTVTQKAWNITWEEIERIAPSIEAMDAYVGTLIANMPNDRSDDADYLQSARPPVPENFSSKGIDLASLLAKMPQPKARQ